MPRVSSHVPTDHVPGPRLKRMAAINRDDRFAVDQSRVPQGMTLEWKRVALLGQEDRRNQVVCAQNHWKSVPHEMQPHILGQFGHDGDPIVQDGLMLMMRPSYLCDEANEEREGDAIYNISQQLQALGSRSRAEVGGANTKFKKSFEAATQPVE